MTEIYCPASSILYFIMSEFDTWDTPIFFLGSLSWISNYEITFCALKTQERLFKVRLSGAFTLNPYVN